MKFCLLFYKWGCLVLVGTLLSGCLTTSSEKFSYNHKTGEYVRVWVDIRSKKAPDEKDYSVENDWELLKEMVLEPEEEYSSKVVKEHDRKIYQDGGNLSGSKRFQVACPECFPSPLEVLKYLNPEQKDLRFETINGDFFLFLPGTRQVLESNGQVVETNGNSIIVWPEDSELFEFEISGGISGGSPLLPYYLEDEDLQKE